MVIALRDLLQESSTGSPYDDGDLGDVLRAGRRRVRHRRAGIVGGVALATVGGSLAVAALLGGGGGRGVDAVGVPTPSGPVLRLSDAVAGVEGADYRTLSTYTNENLNRANGQYFDGVTDDGLILFRDGPHGVRNLSRYALLDPATDRRDWLPPAPHGSGQGSPLELGADRLVLLTFDPGSGDAEQPVVDIFDRDTREWRSVTWADLPGWTSGQLPQLGPGERLYVPVVARQGQVPEGGWPMGPDGEADDADAPGDSYHLWSASLTDPTDVRDEGLTVGSFGFTDDLLVWSERTNGDLGEIHVRDLDTGAEHSFDPRAGDRCNLLSFGVSGDAVVLGEYCGTYGSERDDRVQVLTLEGDPITTIQGDGIDGGLASAADDGGLVSVLSYEGGAVGTYVYDLGSGRFVRVSNGFSSFASGGGPTPPGQLIWSTPVNGHAGQTQVLARWLDRG